MSIHAIAWAQQVQAPLTSNEAFVLVTLAEYADDEGGRCWPAMSTVARKCRMSRATVFRILDRLEHVHGLIRKERSGQRGGKANSYRLMVDRAPRWPAEIPEGSPTDPAVARYVRPNLFDEGVSHGDTPSPVDNDRGVYHGETEGCITVRQGGVSPRDRGVASGATGGVASGATQPTNTRQYPSTRACAGSHVDDFGDFVACGADVPGCELFRIPDELVELGRAKAAELRAALLAKRSSAADATVASALTGRRS